MSYFAKALVVFLVLSQSVVWANLHLAPPDFRYKDTNLVFVDFQTANYEITYDLVKKETTVKTKLVFYSTVYGKPIFDLVPDPYNVILDGKASKDKSIKLPEKGSYVRYVDTNIWPGMHTLEMKNTFDTNVVYHGDFKLVSSAFWIRDLKERMFLEQYIPSNLEFDQYKMVFNVKFGGVKDSAQEVYTNGKVSIVASNEWKIEFPEYFTASSLYFHTTPKKYYPRIDFEYTSIDGRIIPVTIYSPMASRNKKFVVKAQEVLAELENDYGPWGHSSFIAYGTMPGTGGMEHSGATQTSLAALDHEMLHSYFAKGVMPANGNSGWIDEAIASWRDQGYPRLADPGFNGSNMGRRSDYKRSTDTRAYHEGAKFLAYLDYRLQNVGGLKAFLRGYFSSYNHTLITTEHFRNNLEFFSGLDLDKEFGFYIWGRESVGYEQVEFKNKYHPEMTAKQLRDLL